MAKIVVIYILTDPYQTPPIKVVSGVFEGCSKAFPWLFQVRSKGV